MDLGVPDAVLQAEFAQWLELGRQAHPQRTPKRITPANFARWCDDGYVPYHLLRLWGLATGTTFTHELIAEALFPEQRHISESNVRRTIAPAAQEWLSNVTLTALRVQAAHDAVEKTANSPR